MKCTFVVKALRELSVELCKGNVGMLRRRTGVNGAGITRDTSTCFSAGLTVLNHDVLHWAIIRLQTSLMDVDLLDRLEPLVLV